MKYTYYWIIVKSLDYISTKANFALAGDASGEANPVMKSLFGKGELYPICALLLSLVIVAFIENRYKDNRAVTLSLIAVITLTSLVVLSNFITFFIGLKYVL